MTRSLTEADLQTSPPNENGIRFPLPNVVDPFRPVPELPSHWTNLGTVFVTQARLTPDKALCVDAAGNKLTYGEALLRATVIARHISGKVANDEYVGIMVPPSAGGFIANLAVILLGKIGVNLTYAASSNEPNAAIAKCGIKTVLTSSELLQKRGLQLDATCIPLESLKDDIADSTKKFGYFLAKTAPFWLMGCFLRGLWKKRNETVTVMFTSGSTGDPKGVVLSHGNILFNIAQIRDHGKINDNDVLLGVLPYFHSLGYMATFAAVFCLGISAATHENPLDSRKVIKLISDQSVTIMLSTPTLMRPYYKRGRKEQFESIRWLLLGSEKLDPKVAEEIQTKLGLIPNEGYGCTELSPTVSGNVLELVSSLTGSMVDGNKIGTVGQVVPGTRVAIVDRETGELIPPGSEGREGRIFIAGPQVMQGYLNDPEKTDEVLVNGWYYTGDIGYVDEDGFLVITDRESRFAKVGGEMVPMIKVELAIRKIVGSRDVHLSAIPDSKGEKLVVLHTVDSFDVEHVVEQLEAAQFNNLWIPKRNDFHQVEELPIAASGKLDLKELKRMAIELSS